MKDEADEEMGNMICRGRDEEHLSQPLEKLFKAWVPAAINRHSQNLKDHTRIIVEAHHVLLYFFYHLGSQPLPFRTLIFTCFPFPPVQQHGVVRPSQASKSPVRAGAAPIAMQTRLRKQVDELVGRCIARPVLIQSPLLLFCCGRLNLAFSLAM